MFSCTRIRFGGRGFRVQGSGFTAGKGVGSRGFLFVFDGFSCGGFAIVGGVLGFVLVEFGGGQRRWGWVLFRVYRV